MKKLLRIFLLFLAFVAVAFAAFWYARPYDLDFADQRALVPHSERSRFVEIDGVRVHFQEKGSGPPLVLLHGNNSSVYTWRDVFDELAAHHRVVAVDLKGFGFTSKPAGDYRVEAQAALVVRLMDELKIESAVWCGSSFGGGIALAAAINYPARVRGLVLVDSAAFSEHRGASLAPTFVKWPYIGAAVSALALTSDSLVREGLKQSFYDDSKVTNERVAAYYLPLTTRGGQYAARRVRVQRHFERVEQLLGKVTQPALLIWGAEDRLILLEDGRRLQSSLPNSRLVVFDACGHLPQEEMPERFTREALDFTARLKTASPTVSEGVRNSKQ
ncbi:MAG: alpha/beta hydrolase [Acidobacteria bacterium]|nr:alpha/beta hydrolase [Acidobacteriota bacterium]